MTRKMLVSTIVVLLIVGFLGGSLMMIAPVQETDADAVHTVTSELRCPGCGALLSITVYFIYHNHSS